MDQAKVLRDLNKGNGKGPVGGMSPQSGTFSPRKRVRVVAITSGKGGVGKTSISANLAYILSGMGKKILVVDADTGLANMDVVLGLTPKYNISHVLSGEKSLAETIVAGPGGFFVLPAASGVQEMADLSRGQKLTLLDEINSWNGDIEYLLIDTGAGIAGNVMYFNMAAREVVVVVSPEPTSITDAYALMKVLYKHHAKRRFMLLVNMVKGETEAIEVYNRISQATDHFLNLSVDYLGFIVSDEAMKKSIRKQKVVAELYPNSPASKCLLNIAQKLREEKIVEEENVPGFF